MDFFRLLFFRRQTVAIRQLWAVLNPNQTNEMKPTLTVDEEVAALQVVAEVLQEQRLEIIKLRESLGPFVSQVAGLKEQIEQSEADDTRRDEVIESLLNLAEAKITPPPVEPPPVVEVPVEAPADAPPEDAPEEVPADAPPADEPADEIPGLEPAAESPAADPVEPPVAG